MPTEIYARNFKTRDDLERHVTSKYGRNTNPVELTVIFGTRQELAEKNLSHGKRVWGVIVIDSEHEEPMEVSPPDRGEVKKSGLNGGTTSIRKR